MKYCKQCDLKAREPALFCIRCGSSFGLRYCPRLHPNPTSADYCYACGSSDLSTANPPYGWSLWHIALILILTIFALAFVAAILGQSLGLSMRQYIGGIILILSIAGGLAVYSSICKE